MRPSLSTGDDASRNAVEHGLDVLPAAFDVLVLLLQLDRRSLEPETAGGEIAGHAIECVDQRCELVARLHLNAMIEMTGTDFVRRRGQHLHGARNPLRQVQSHPCRGHQNHQREHQEEREVDARKRWLQDFELTVVHVCAGQAPCARGELAGEVVARDQNAADGSVRRGTKRHRCANQVAAVLSR